jgi:hypothetical protein
VANAELICDDYGSHTFKDFLQYARDNRIVVISLLLRTSHFLQPLDVVLFQPYKHYHRKAVNSAARIGCESFRVVEFMADIGGICKQIFKPKLVRSAFGKAGI